MGLGNRTEPAREERIYLNIAHGRIELNQNGQKNYYTYVEGKLRGICSREREFRGETSKYYYLELVGDEGELYSIGFSENSGVLLSIVNSLASDETLSPSAMIRIETYEVGGYTKVIVWSEGVKLDWLQRELPPIKTIDVGGKSYKDYTLRNQFTEDLVARINQRIGIG